MRTYSLAITANKAYVENNTEVEREWNMALTSASPFSLNRSYSQNASYINNNDFGFSQTKLEPARRTLTGNIIFKGTALKKAEALMQEFIAFSSEPELDFDIFESTDARTPTKARLEKYFQRKILKSTNTDTGKTLFCYVTAISLSKIQRMGADIIATLTMVATSLWLEEVNYTKNTTDALTFQVQTEAPTEVSFWFDTGTVGTSAVNLKWSQDKNSHTTGYSPLGTKRLAFAVKEQSAFVGNVRGVDVCLYANSTFYTTYYPAYSRMGFADGYFTKCIVENGDTLTAETTDITRLYISYMRKYWSD